MATNQEKLVGLNGIAAVRDWANQKFSGGSGSGLPEVTSDDNGDVLTVVNGSWDKAAPSGGDPGYVVTRSATHIVEEQTVTADGEDSAHAEIEQALVPEEEPEHIVVTLDGVEYEVDRVYDDDGGYYYYGDYDCISPPFTLYLVTQAQSEQGWQPGMSFASSGSHTIKAVMTEVDVTVTDDFKIGVEASEAYGYGQGITDVYVCRDLTVTTEETVGDGCHGEFYGLNMQVSSNMPQVSVTFNDNIEERTYTLDYNPDEFAPVGYYGDRTFTDVPFWFRPPYEMNGYTSPGYLNTSEPGNYTISISYEAESIIPTDKFKTAVRESGIHPPIYIDVVDRNQNSGTSLYPGIPQSDVQIIAQDDLLKAYDLGTQVYFRLLVSRADGFSGEYVCVPAERTIQGLYPNEEKIYVCTANFLINSSSILEGRFGYISFSINAMNCQVNNFTLQMSVIPRSAVLDIRADLNGEFLAGYIGDTLINAEECYAFLQDACYVKIAIGVTTYSGVPYYSTSISGSTSHSFTLSRFDSDNGTPLLVKTDVTINESTNIFTATETQYELTVHN